MKYYIFGAHSRGYTLFEYLRTLEPDNTIFGFLFDNDEPNPEEIEGVPVLHIEEENISTSLYLDTTSFVYIATRGIYHEKITKKLKNFGFCHFIYVDPKFDSSLRNRYVNIKFKERGIDFYKIVPDYPSTDNKCAIGINLTDNKTYSKKAKRKQNDADYATIYIAQTIYDKSFKDNISLKRYESLIQVGCALTDKRLQDVDFFDDSNRDTISPRNRQFSELTGLYWLWRHSDQSIVGLNHWRRRFILPDDWQQIMEEQAIDVILPVPLCVMPSLKDNYLSRHDETVWNKTIEIMDELYQGEGESFDRYCSVNSLYSPCNMIIARREVLSDYCNWLFPVLIRLNDAIGTLDDAYQNRYPGFISERMLTYFFDKNRTKYRIAYADKSFLQ